MLVVELKGHSLEIARIQSDQLELRGCARMRQVPRGSANISTTKRYKTAMFHPHECQQRPPSSTIIRSGRSDCSSVAPNERGNMDAHRNHWIVKAIPFLGAACLVRLWSLSEAFALPAIATAFVWDEGDFLEMRSRPTAQYDNEWV